jgi:hypothetical protein
MNDPIDPIVRRRNTILGLALAGFALALMGGFAWTFVRGGLPKDPKVWKQMQETDQQRTQQP